jgi:hypothetical protein
MRLPGSYSRRRAWNCGSICAAMRGELGIDQTSPTLGHNLDARLPRTAQCLKRIKITRAISSAYIRKLNDRGAVMPSRVDA